VRSVSFCSDFSFLHPPEVRREPEHDAPTELCSALASLTINMPLLGASALGAFAVVLCFLSPAEKSESRDLDSYHDGRLALRPHSVSRLHPVPSAFLHLACARLEME